MPKHPANLDNRRARAYCLAVGAERFFSLVYLLSFLSPSMGGGPM